MCSSSFRQKRVLVRLRSAHTPACAVLLDISRSPRRIGRAWRMMDAALACYLQDNPSACGVKEVRKYDTEFGSCTL